MIFTENEAGIHSILIRVNFINYQLHRRACEAKNICHVDVVNYCRDVADCACQQHHNDDCYGKKFRVTICLDDAGKTTDGKKTVAYQVELHSNTCNSTISGVAKHFSNNDDYSYLPNGYTA